ncbi:adenosine deaminase domain-containing protein 1 isoform X2 [Paroedura picta]|uniref:adenosine deaminase domain-containing protein 1 isoform X2 n=1 Tax=Paroedura picta TaxID=143630 RepID=UPI004057C5D4
MASDWPQASRVPSFAQMLKKNLPAQPQPSTQPAAPLHSQQVEHAQAMFAPSDVAEASSLASKLTPVTGHIPAFEYSKAAPVSPITFLPPKKIPKEFMVKYKRGEINPVSALHQFAQMQRVQLELKETVATGNLLGSYFAFCAVVDGIQYKTGLGQNKKESKSNAAKLALDELLQLEELEPKATEKPGSPKILPELSVVAEPQSPAGPGYLSKIPYEGPDVVSEKISQVIRETFNSLTAKYPEYQNCSSSLAAFIVERARQYEVVAIGTGEFNYSQCSHLDGRILHDSHSVVTARRSLLRYFYRQLLLYHSKNPAMMEKSIFYFEPTSTLLAIKPNIHIFLYMNQLPKGSAQIKSKSKICLTPNSVSSFESGEELSLHIAVEGDANCHDTRGLEIAIKQRVDDTLTSKLPMFYLVNRPHISLVTSAYPVLLDLEHRSLSLNWSQGDTSLEVVDGLNGKTTESSPFKSGVTMASRLCKAAMLSRFNLLVKESKRDDLLKAAATYHEAKFTAESYQEAKTLLKTYLEEHGYGSWIVKSPRIEHFSM